MGRFTLVTLAVFSLLPIWPAWYFSSWEGLEKPASFWTMLASVPRAIEHHSPATLLTRCYGPDVIPPAVLLCVCLFVGRRLAGWRQRVMTFTPESARVVAICLFLFVAPLFVAFGR